MRKILFILFFISCSSSQKSLPVSYGETIDGVPFITGKINRQNLIDYKYSNWFVDEYDRYRVPDGWVKKNKKLLNNMSLKLFLGTWCEDSEREVPGMIKLLESSGFDFSKIDIYAVTEEKNTPENYEKDLNIINVPTLIFFKNNKEINRFVEFPNISLAKDLENIIQGKEYKNPYSETNMNE